MEATDLYVGINIQPTRNNRYKVLKEITYKDVTVPVGYTTDGASIPRIFWSFWPPNRSDYLPAAIVHDYMTDQNKDYKKADIYFKEIMEELGIDDLTIFFFYNSVRVYHKLKYND